MDHLTPASSKCLGKGVAAKLAKLNQTLLGQGPEVSLGWLLQGNYARFSQECAKQSEFISFLQRGGCEG